MTAAECSDAGKGVGFTMASMYESAAVVVCAHSKSACSKVAAVYANGNHKHTSEYKHLQRITSVLFCIYINRGEEPSAIIAARKQPDGASHKHIQQKRASNFNQARDTCYASTCSRCPTTSKCIYSCNTCKPTLSPNKAAAGVGLSTLKRCKSQQSSTACNYHTQG
jgi:hypothetical protein